MKIKLLIDEDVHATLSEALRKRGYDAINVQELGKKGISDQGLIDEAIKNRSCIMTYNIKDFIILHNNFLERNQSHFGIIVSKQLSLGETLKRLLKILKTSTAEKIKGRVEFL